jgi:hypothetical protein
MSESTRGERGVSQLPREPRPGGGRGDYSGARLHLKKEVALGQRQAPGGFTDQ